MQTRCTQHTGLSAFPVHCDTCQRINVERAIVTRTVDALLAAGYALATDEGDHRFYGPVSPTRDRQAILDAVGETDFEYLGCFDAAEAEDLTPRVCKALGWVLFVYGNEGWDVIADHTTGLAGILAPVDAFADDLERLAAP